MTSAQYDTDVQIILSPLLSNMIVDFSCGIMKYVK